MFMPMTKADEWQKSALSKTVFDIVPQPMAGVEVEECVHLHHIGHVKDRGERSRALVQLPHQARRSVCRVLDERQLFDGQVGLGPLNHEQLEPWMSALSQSIVPSEHVPCSLHAFLRFNLRGGVDGQRFALRPSLGPGRGSSDEVGICRFLCFTTMNIQVPENLGHESNTRGYCRCTL